MCTKKNIRNAFLAGALIVANVSVSAQQNVIANKDNTRPEVTKQYSSPALVTTFTAIRNNGYNEIQWTGRAQQETRRYIVEYSTDGINFQMAGEALATPGGSYQLKHQTFELAPLLYRVQTEDFNGAKFFSPVVLLEGVDVVPVKIYPTVITGNVVNVRSAFPVERVMVVAANGQQVFAQDVNGRAEYMTFTMPSLKKGMYWMHFTGRGWKTSSNFIVE